jgi:hypothetical protein
MFIRKNLAADAEGKYEEVARKLNMLETDLLKAMLRSSKKNNEENGKQMFIRWYLAAEAERKYEEVARKLNMLETNLLKAMLRSSHKINNE